MPSAITYRQPAAAARLLLSWGLAWVLLVGLLGAWTQARATSGTVGASELSYFMPAEDAGDMRTSAQADSGPAGLACSKPAELKATTTDLVPNEVSDKDVHSCVLLWLTLPQAIPAQGPPIELPQTVREPLLRPPALLG
jgi:hypothetical protein